MISVRQIKRCLLVVGVMVLFLEFSKQERKIPDSFWRDISKMKTTDDFFKKYGRPLRGRTRNMGQLREFVEGTIINGPSVFDNLPMTTCVPQNLSVKVPIDSNPMVFRVPPCVILQRCGGCCIEQNRETCKPTSTGNTSVTVTVTRTEHHDDGSITQSTEQIAMEYHTACACTCRYIASECNSATHIFNSAECTCKCRNEDDSPACTSPKTWNDTLCKCACPHELLRNCPENQDFSFNTCSCVNIASRVFPARNVEASPTPSDLCEFQSCRPGFSATLVSGRCRCLPDGFLLPSYSWGDRRRRRELLSSVSNELQRADTGKRGI